MWTNIFLKVVLGCFMGLNMRLNKVQMQSSLDFESAAFSEFAFTSGGFTEDVFTVVAGDYSLCVTEDDGSFVAASALDIHEIGVGGRN